MLTPAQRQAAYQARRAARMDRMATALTTIRDELAGSTTDKGRKLHAIAAGALEGKPDA